MRTCCWLVALIISVLTITRLQGQTGSGVQAREELNRGVGAFKAGRYEEAIDHFKSAVALDPNFMTARLYLGTAYMQQYVPGVDTPENNRLADLGAETFTALLDIPDLPKPTKLTAIKSLASLEYNRKAFDQSKKFYRQAIEIDPGDAELYYMIGVINWAETYKAAMDAKAKVGLKTDDQYQNTPAQAALCQEQRTANEPKIAEGLDALQQALGLRPDYEDAMAYMNLLYRRKGDIECGDLSARAADLQIADEWSDKVMATRRARQQEAPTAK